VLRHGPWTGPNQDPQKKTANLIDIATHIEHLNQHLMAMAAN